MRSIRKTIGLVALLTVTLTAAQKNIYEHIRFNALSKDHKVLAILPFIAHLDLKKQVDRKALDTLAKREGYAVQQALETYFYKRKQRKKFDVAFQNSVNTNAMLAQHGISYENLDIYTTQQLCSILKVDGLVSGSLNLNILLSEGVPTEFNLLDYFSGDANYGRIGIKISDGTTRKLLWKYEHVISKKTGKNTTELIDKMMRSATRRFPYDKEKRG